MSCRISVLGRIPQSIGIPVQALGIAGLRYHTVRTDEPTDVGVVETRSESQNGDSGWEAV